MRLFEVLVDRTGHGVPVIHFEDHFPAVVEKHLPDVIEALFEIAVIDEVVLLAPVGEEGLKLSPERLGIALKLGELGLHAVGFLVKVENESVFEEIPPVRRDGLELHVVLHALASTLPETLEELGQREDRGPEIEAVAVDLGKVELAADALVLLDDLDIESLGFEGDGGGEASEACSDDNDIFLALLRVSDHAVIPVLV